jgi:hypothetical protein
MMLNKNEDSGFGIGHKNGVWGFVWLFDGVQTFYEFTDQEALSNGAVNFQAPQINRLRMLYLGFGALIAEVQNDDHTQGDLWRCQYVKRFINDATRLLPNLSDPDLGLGIVIRNNGLVDCIVRTNSWGIGPVIGDVGQQQPDGDRLYPKADGLARDIDLNGVEFSQVLPAAGSVSSNWVDTDGWGAIDLVIQSNQLSADTGVVLEFTDDVQALSPQVRQSLAFSYNANDVEAGALKRIIPTTLDGFRITYVNGDTQEDAFYLSATLRVQAVVPTNTLTSSISGSSSSGS